MLSTPANRARPADDDSSIIDLQLPELFNLYRGYGALYLNVLQLLHTYLDPSKQGSS